MRDFKKDLEGLKTLFSCLPSDLPVDPADSHLNFELDSDLIAEEGWGVKFNHCMEVAWETWKGPIQVLECGANLDKCIVLLELALEQIDGPLKEVWVGGWIDKLQAAAIAAGSHFRSSTTSVISISDDSDNMVTQDGDPQDEPSDFDESGWTDSPYDTNNPPKPDYISSGDSATSHGAQTCSSLEVVINYTPLAPSAPAGSTGTLRQTKLTFQKVDCETYQEQCAREAQKMKALWEAHEAAKLAHTEQKEEERRVKDKLRKQQDRARAKAEDIQSGRRTSDGQLVNDKQKHADPQPLNLEIDCAQACVVQSSRARKNHKDLEEVLTSIKP